MNFFTGQLLILPSDVAAAVRAVPDREHEAAILKIDFIFAVLVDLIGDGRHRAGLDFIKVQLVEALQVLCVAVLRRVVGRMHCQRCDRAGELAAGDGFDRIAERPCAAAAAGEVLVEFIVPALKIACFQMQDADVLTLRLGLQRRAQILDDLSVVAVRDVVVMQLGNRREAADKGKQCNDSGRNALFVPEILKEGFQQPLAKQRKSDEGGNRIAQREPVVGHREEHGKRCKQQNQANQRLVLLKAGFRVAAGEFSLAAAVLQEEKQRAEREYSN